MRRLPRIHRQTLLTDDTSDTIAAHSFRTAIIAWFLAKKEKVDPYKAVMMALIHDMAEARTGDHNWVHKRYVKIFDDMIYEEQLGDLPYADLKELVDEYQKRKSKEAIIAKQADLLDQILILREYEWQGNKEAPLWLYGNTFKAGQKIKGKENKIKSLTLKSARDLGKEIYNTPPSEWWQHIWTNKNK